MKLLTISAILGLSLAGFAQADSPTLKETVGIGGGFGGQYYSGSFGSSTGYYGRGFLVFNPMEMLGVRLGGGFGDIQSGAYETRWFSNVGLELVVQPQIPGLGSFRPYLASGISSTTGHSNVNSVRNQDLNWNYYIPGELGLEYLISQSVSVWAWGETYLYMDKYDRLDGVSTPGSYFDRRDDLYKAGLGITLRIGEKSDADHDGVSDAKDRCPNTPSGVMVDKNGCPLDSDHDGVPDYLDKCPSTPTGVVVDDKGCALDADQDGVPDYKDRCPNTPKGVLVDSLGCTLVIDSDHDGISDDKDQCPNTPVGVKVDAVGCPFDSDHDGIPDDRDQCPNTPMGVKVDAAGCPLVIDSDLDGVPDDKDHCPNTPRGVQVDAVGCPITIDADHDGVPDSKDQCPGTPLGQRVDSLGCPVIVIEKGTKLILSGIEFKSGSAEIEAVSVPVLTRAANALVKAPEAKVEIAGFTDNVGKALSNRKLSKSRAEAVRRQLIKLGAKPEQITAVGYGSEEPIADNDTKDGRTQNRRIEFRVK